MKHGTREGASSAFSHIRPGSIVSIVDRFGKVRKGRAVMFNQEVGCWVLNMGGAHGTPGIATINNVVAVKEGYSQAFALINGRGA
jgi:hypothetical protein